LQNTITGEQELWEMHGTEIGVVTPLPNVDSGWRIAGADDFDSDGTTDILWFDADNGVVHIWFMGDFAGDGPSDLALEPGWVIIGSGDFDGDGRSEIAISNHSSRIEFWGVSGDFVRLGQLSMRHSWEIVGIGDVDGDGTDDMIFQDLRERTIEVLLLSSDFSTRKVVLDKQRIAQWNIIDSADYDGNGQSDLLCRNLSDRGRGGAGVWHLSSGLYLNGRPLDLNLGANLSVVGSADYDADGAADLLVFDPAISQLALWLLDRAGVHGFQSLGSLATGWLPAGFHTNDNATTP
jgi:hypothetical protein